MDINYTISSSQSGMRLDRCVTDFYPECSRSRAAALISSGDIRIQDQMKRPAYKVKPGERITGRISLQATISIPLAEFMDLNILYEDDQIIVLDKPAGLVVHPGAGNESHTLVNGLLSHYPDICRASDDPLRPGIIHRLDKDTTGLILVAKTLNSLEFLKKEFKQRRVKKKYMAIVMGEGLAESGIINSPIGRHPKNRKMMAVVEGGKPAITGWMVRQQLAQAALVEIFLYTGRTHQIRAHFYAMGHPLMGDPVYQFKRFRKQRKAPVGRQMLHAFSLRFRHPYSGRKMCFTSDLPEDFSKMIDKLS